jgi:uncharacterized protein (DUF849 family)
MAAHDTIRAVAVGGSGATAVSCAKLPDASEEIANAAFAAADRGARVASLDPGVGNSAGRKRLKPSNAAPVRRRHREATRLLDAFPGQAAVGGCSVEIRFKPVIVSRSQGLIA